MKKLIALIIALCMVCMLCAACGSEEAEPAAAPAATEAPEAAPEAAPEVEKQSSEAPAEDMIELPVTIENKTGVDIHQLFATSANLEQWGEDILGEDVLEDGASLESVFNIGADDLKWDLMMVDSEGTEIELYGLDFTECSTEGGTIVLEFDGTNGTATLYSE